MRTAEERARLHRLTTAANKINKRLDIAAKTQKGTIYGNELGKRVITYGQPNGLIVITPRGVRLTRSAKAWEQLPEGEADAIIMELEALGSFQAARERARALLHRMGVHDADDDDINKLMTGALDLVANSHAIWEMAYEEARYNAKLHDFFQKLFGKQRGDKSARDQQTEWLLKQLLGEAGDGGNPNFTSISPINQNKPFFGYNIREDEMNIAARNITRNKYTPTAEDPETVAKLLNTYAAAKYGHMNADGTFTRETDLTPEQLRAVIRKFNK